MTPAWFVIIMKQLLAPLGLALLFLGCAAPTSEEETGEGSTQALNDAEISFRVVGFGTEMKTAEYGRRERLLGTARPDDQMKAEMLPRVRAKAAASLASACAFVTEGTGHLVEAPRDELVRAERIFRVTEFIVEVSNAQTCTAPAPAMRLRASQLVKMFAEGKDIWSVRAAIVALKEDAAAPVITEIESRIGADGNLDLSEEAAHGNANWTINHVIRVVQILKDLKTENPRALPALRALRAAVANGNGAAWAQGEIDRAITALTR
jgi:hypothetical protein